MSLMNYEKWPFQVMQARSLQEQALWWENCYVPMAVDRALAEHWSIIVGGPGSGKSATLFSLVQREGNKALLLDYKPERWPGEKYALAGGKNHLAQIMATAGIEIRDILTDNPEKIKELSAVQCEFIRWLLQKHGGPRAFVRWVDSLPSEYTTILGQVKYEDIYPTPTDPIDAQGQIDELASLARKLGFERVLVLVDMNQFEAQKYILPLANLFDWLDLMHHPGLSLVAAVPRFALENANLVERTRGRVGVFYLTWEIEQVREIALRHIHQAVEEKNLNWNKLINNGALSKMEKFLTEVYEGVAPAGWLALAESILFLANRSANAYSLPLTGKHLNELKRAVYQRHIPIRLDPSGPGIWRGPEYIPLTKKPFQFLEAVQRRTGSVRVTDEDLLAVAGTSGNIHSLASRTRSLIEPFPKKPVYLVNRSGEGGYQLENSIY